MRYNVAQLLKGSSGASRRYDLREEIRNLDPDLEVLQPLVGTVRLMRTSQGILATGELQTEVRTECRRCLEPCDVEIEFSLEEEFYPSARVGPGPLDDTPEEEQDEALLIDEHNVLDLSEVVRQQLWLELSSEMLCRVDCAGLCPRCGGNRNRGECECGEAPIDVRWAALGALLSEES
jgi:uncharacterized protein